MSIVNGSMLIVHCFLSALLRYYGGGDSDRSSILHHPNNLPIFSAN
jgi:hypothetical protein